jgi:hypothetical protein
MALALLKLHRSTEPAMPLKKLYHSVSCARAALYTAFGSPSCGITWSVVTFLAALLYLIYDEHKRQIVETAATNDAPELEGNGEASDIEAHLT